MGYYTFIILFSIITLSKNKTADNVVVPSRCDKLNFLRVQEFTYSDELYYSIIGKISNIWNPLYFLLEESVYCYLYNFINVGEYYLVRASCIHNRNITMDLMKWFLTNDTQFNRHNIEYIDDIGDECDKIKPKTIQFGESEFVICEDLPFNYSMLYIDYLQQQFVDDDYLKQISSSYLVEYFYNAEEYTFSNLDKCQCIPENYLEKCTNSNKHLMHIVAMIYTASIIFLILFHTL